MIYPLRRRHFYIWVGIALILPTLLILAWHTIPESSIKSVATDKQTALKVYQPWAEASEYKEGSDYYLGLKLKEPVISPGTLIYLGSEETSTVNESILLGRVEGAGIYSFSIPGSVMDKGNILLFYDPFHKKVISSLPI